MGSLGPDAQVRVLSAAAAPSAPGSAPAAKPAPTRTKLALAFAAVYVIWGSTYLAIRYAIDTLPPFPMAAARFLVAGSLLYAWARIRGAPAPTGAQWRGTSVVGALLLFGGNGAVVWAEQRVPTGITALLVATAAIWMVLLEWLWRGGPRPGPLVIAGLVLGLAGLALLVAPSLGSSVAAGEGVDLLGAGVLMAGTFSWAAGSIYARSISLPRSPALATAMEMLAGGALLLLAGLVTGQFARIDPQAVTARSVAALGYLVVFGSIVAFTAYVWLLEVSTPSRVATYAYVNPVVAVLLGWALAGEPLGAGALAAAGVIVAGVAAITAGSARGGAVKSAKSADSDEAA
jgi:drug/metabolite transporter (DMT)-like permease